MPPSNERLTPPPSRVSRAFVERVSTKVQALLWVVSAVVLLVYGRVVEAASDPRKSNS